MKIFKCDRCGKTYEKVSTGFDLVTYKTTGMEAKDLCQECSDKLIDWFVNVEKGEQK